MLKKVKIKNFKSFKNFEINLEKFNCIIAPNNAGKTNLMEAFRFLNLAFKNISNAIEEFGGYNEMRNIFLDEQNIYFEVELLENDKKYYATVTINKDIQNSTLLFMNLHNENPKYIENLFKKYFYSYSFYPNEIKHFLKGGNILRYDGQNIIDVMDFMKNSYIERFEQVSSSLIGIVEELNHVDIGKDVIDRNILLFKEKNKDLPMDIVSDGTINLLAILTAIYEPQIKKMICFDEIEKHLHLKAIDYILDILQEEEIQVAFTTQSSQIINNLNLEKQNLIFLYRDYDGFTKSINANKIKNFKNKIQRYKDITTIIQNEVLGYLGDFDE